MTAVTDASGTVTLPTHPGGTFKLSAYGDGCEGTYTTVDVSSGSGPTIAYVGLAIVVIVVAIIALRAKKKD